MSITKLGISIEGPVLKSVDLGIDMNWSGKLPKTINLSKVILVDKRDDTRIPIFKWIAGLLKDPIQNTELQKLVKKGNMTVVLKKNTPLHT